MGIELDSGPIQPAVEYKRIFLKEMVITQRMLEDDDQVPDYSITLDYQKYGVLGTKRFFLGIQEGTTIDNFIPEAVALAQQGKPELLQALQALEHAVAVILEYKTGTPTKVI